MKEKTYKEFLKILAEQQVKDFPFPVKTLEQYCKDEGITRQGAYWRKWKARIQIFRKGKFSYVKIEGNHQNGK